MPLCNTDNSACKADTTSSIPEGIRQSTLYDTLHIPRLGSPTALQPNLEDVTLKQRMSRFSYLRKNTPTGQQTTVCRETKLLHQPAVKPSCPDQLPFWVTLNSSQVLQDTAKFSYFSSQRRMSCRAANGLLRSTRRRAVSEERGTGPVLRNVPFAKHVRIFCD